MKYLALFFVFFMYSCVEPRAREKYMAEHCDEQCRKEIYKECIFKANGTFWDGKRAMCWRLTEEYCCDYTK